MGEQMYRVVCTDSLDRESHPERWASDPMIWMSANVYAVCLNEKEGPNSPNYYRVVKLPYELYRPDWMKEE